MKLIRSTLASLALVFTSNVALAGDWGSTSLGERLAHRNCAWCHGTSGQGFATAPRLAGQTRQYIENQIASSRNHMRDNPKTQAFMWGVAALTSREAAVHLAEYFSSLSARPANDGNERLTAEGRALYRDGSPAANIPSCVVCHGPNGEGRAEIPRLGGLSYRYLKRKLEQWGEGYHATALVPMPGIATKLSAGDIEAISSYLSFVE